MATQAVFLEAVCVQDEALRSITAAAVQAAGEAASEAARDAVEEVAGAEAGEAAGAAAAEAATRAAGDAAAEVALEAAREAAQQVGGSRKGDESGGRAKPCEAIEPSSSGRHWQAPGRPTRQLLLVKLASRSSQPMGKGLVGLVAWASDLESCSWTGELDEEQIKAQVQSKNATCCY